MHPKKRIAVEKISIIVGASVALLGCARGESSVADDNVSLPTDAGAAGALTSTPGANVSPTPPGSVAKLFVGPGSQSNTGGELVDDRYGFGVACALMTEGSLYCWGNDFYLRPHPSAAEAPAPPELASTLYPRREPVPPLVSLAYGAFTTDPAYAGSSFNWSRICGVGTDTRVYCWCGMYNGLTPDNLSMYDLMGDGISHDVASCGSPIDIGVSGAKDVVMNGNATCLLMLDGTVRCWGYDSVGSVGLGELPNSTLTPTQVPGLLNIVELSAGAPMCALAADGTVQCWGGPQIDGIGSAGPHAVYGVANVAHITTSSEGMFGITTAGQVLLWGGNAAYAVGYTPELRAELSPARDVPIWSYGSVSAATTCASDLLAVGLGPDQALHTQCAAPSGLIPNLAGMHADLAAGGGENICILKDGLVLCAGFNALGQLGDGTTTSRSAFAPVLWPRTVTPPR
jgi:hypothetical protein